MTADQIRQRLAAMGHDPKSLDAYMVETTLDESLPAPTPGALAALNALMPAAPDTFSPQPEPAPRTEEEKRLDLRVYGTEVFARGGSEFEAVATGALPATYVLGPGDELVLVITGDVEQTHALPVTREGFVLIPQVGQVWVNGITLADLREQLYARLGSVYSGIRRGAGASTHFDVSIARTRMNQIFVSGDVTRPGSYAVSPLASLLNALYQAGGPTGNGSFRDVRVVRGGKVVASVDLYQYLLAGNNLGSVRLENGDVVFVPVHGPHVAIEGQVAREAIYELRGSETIADLIAVAGGLNAPAHTRRARLTRILPPQERRDPGVDRVVLDIDIDAALRAPQKAPSLHAGDQVVVLAINSEVRRTVSVNGSVWREGTYEFRSGMRAWDLIEAGDGLQPGAYTPRAHIARVDRTSGSVTVIPFSLERNAAGQPAENPALTEDDVVRVYSRSESSADLTVQVAGAVRKPYTERFEQGMTLKDAIIRAGGLKPTADMVIEVSRIADPAAREKGEIAQVFQVRLDSTYFVTDEAQAFYQGDRDALRKAATEKSSGDMPLRPFDRIFVRSVPDFELTRVVTISGEVKFPGAYALRRKDERLRDIIERSGGITATAYATGFRLKRDGDFVDIDLPAVLKNPQHASNLILMPGDELTVPEYNPVVIVQGAVGSPAAVLFRKGANLDYYIGNAGGYSRDADKSSVFIKMPNGSTETSHRTVLLFRATPTPQPGSVVTVPFLRPEDKTDTRAIIKDITQIFAAVGTVALVILRLD